MKQILYILLLLLLPLTLPAQSTDQNYILARTYLEKDGSRYNDQIQYFDGLGRPVQTVQKAITQEGKDLVNFTEYDGWGNERKNWLPAPSLGNTGAYISLSDFTALANNQYSTGEQPYSTTEFEPSPLNKVTGQYGAGKAWYDAGKKVTTEYGTNTNVGVDVVARFYVNGSGQLQRDGNNHAANTLFKTTVTDEDGKSTIEYKDKLGRVVMTRNCSKTDVNYNADTYFVYNDLGQRAYVLPPNFVDGMGGTTSFPDDNTLLKQFGYLYQYDDRGNCKYKRLPGCEPIYMVYDRAERLILSQDGNQRGNAQWTVTKYDAFGRTIFTGTTGAIPNSTALDDLILVNKDKLIIESYNSGSGYTCTNFCDASPLIINYYDSYNFTTFVANGGSFNWGAPPSGFDGQYLDSNGQPNANGLLTGTVVYRLNDPTKYETTALYYDDRGRVVQTRATNHLGGYDITYNALDFTGKPTKTYKTHNIAGQASVVELYTYDYNKAQQPITTTYSLNGGSLVTLASNSYDELGRLKTKTLGGVDATTYNYNIRSWTTDIVGSRFSENLYYNANTVGLPNFTPAYNGNIAGMQWGVANESGNRAYSFTYDGLDRLTDAIYTGFSGGVINGTQNRYDEHFGFDKMGNFNTLTRNENGSLLNNLSFAYTGNQLKKVDNSIAPYIPYGSEAFNDKQKIDTEYSYDQNGSTKWDVNTGISLIQYNLLNLPDQIQFAEGHKNMYTYDASGNKLEAVNYTVHNIVNIPINTISALPSNPSDYTKLTTDYVGNMIYENGSLKQILLPEGYYQGGVYYYYLKDHLGNNRVVINSSGAIIEKSHYYPSGMRFSPESTSNSAALPYRYNGKELEAMNGLNQYDYGARRRGAGLPIWTAVDPLAEKYPNISSYVYCADNPIKYIDPNGEDIKIGGQNGSSVIFKTDLIDVSVDASSIGVDFGGTYTLQGEQVLGAALDIVGIFDPTGVADGLNAALSAENGEWLDAGISAIGLIPYAGDLAKAGKIKKDINIIESGIDAIKEAKSAKQLLKEGRAGKQARLKELADDPKLGKADKGWIKQEKNQVDRGKRSNLRNPPGKDLAHPRGKEAAKGYSYKHAKLNNRADHRTQHRYDNNGRANKARK